MPKTPTTRDPPAPATPALWLLCDGTETIRVCDWWRETEAMGLTSWQRCRANDLARAEIDNHDAPPWAGALRDAAARVHRVHCAYQLALADERRAVLAALAERHPRQYAKIMKRAGKAAEASS